MYLHRTSGYILYTLPRVWIKHVLRYAVFYLYEQGFQQWHQLLYYYKP